MIIFDIINEELYSREDFIKSFDKRQWNNILMFFTQEKLRAAKTQQARQSALDSASVKVGPTTTAESPAHWNKLAGMYEYRNHQMSVSKMNPTWQDIHNHLKKYAEQSVNLPGVDAPVPQTDITVDRDKVGEWVPWNGNAAEYIKAWIAKLKEKRSEDWNKELGARTVEGNKNKIRLGLESMYNRLKATPDIEKWQVDAELLAWLQSADKLITTRIAGRKAAG